MNVVDLNVLLYAVNEDSAHHEKAYAWWETALNADQPIALAWTVVLGFLRIVTNPKSAARPIPLRSAIEKVDGWLTHPNVRLIAETEHHWMLLREMIEETGTAGNLTTDAHLAAIAISHGARLISCDSDFVRFKKLRWENPCS
jgi:toxin-antitoxin system PIN domain toxin